MTAHDERLGQVLSAALGEGPSAATLAAQRRRLLGSPPRNRLGAVRSATRVRIAILAAAGAVALILALGRHWSRPRSELHATWSGRSVVAPAVFLAVRTHPEALDFSEGSQFLLEPDTRAELLYLSPSEGRLALDDGHLLASVRKNTGITWSIGAGPYSIRVMGTRFTVDWDREKRTLRVAVREGRVRVSGGDLAQDGVLLDAGAFLEREYEPARVALATPSALPAATLSAAAASGVAPESPRASIATTAAEPGWEVLARQGKFRDALAAAEKAGFDRLVTDSSEDGLLLLANSARYSGSSARARQALLGLRVRFAGRRSAALAAYYLAREALDVERQPAVAVRWFETFLAESPRGDLAESARANLMSILLGMGDRAKARKVAAEYLRYHPHGAQAKEARSLTEPSASTQ